jgi:uncharacterized protein YxjI
MLEKSKYIVRQKIEPLEFLGFETRNKYQVLEESGAPALFVAEQNKSLLGALARQFFGHRQRLNLFIFDTNKQKVLEIFHPFTFFFQRLHIHDGHGKLLGKCIHRFGILRRRIDLVDANDNLVMQVETPIAFFVNWNYPIFRNGRLVAQVDKKFSGVLQEMFTDADNFLISFQDAAMEASQRSLVLGAAILVDLLFFEAKAKG